MNIRYTDGLPWNIKTLNAFLKFKIRNLIKTKIKTRILFLVLKKLKRDKQIRYLLS